MGPRMLCGSTLRACALHVAAPAVATAGFDAMSAWGVMVARSLDAGWSLADLRTLLDDHGVALDCVEPVADWVPGADATDAIPMSELLDMAVALGSRMVLASTNGVGDATDPSIIDGLATLAEQAGDRGLLVGLEFLGWGTVRDLPTAWAMVQAADRPALRLVFDTWHQRRGTGTDDDIDLVPAAMVTAIQLADGPAAGEDDLVLEARFRRQLPGDGTMDVAGQLRRLADHGVQAPVGVEVWREGNQDDPVAAARRAFAALTAVLPG